MSDQHDPLPRGWAFTSLGEIGRYHNGRGFKKAEWSDYGRPIIRIQNLTDPSKPFNYFEGDVDPRNEVYPGDLLVSWAATLDVFRWNGPEAVLNQHIFKVESFINREFHYYLLQHALDAIRRQTHGSGMVHVTRERFDSTPIAIPPRREQERIVETLEEHLSAVATGVAELASGLARLPRHTEAVLAAAVSGRLISNDFEDADGGEVLRHALTRRRERWQSEGLGRCSDPMPPRPSAGIELPLGWAWASVDQLSVGTQYGSSAKASPEGPGVPVIRMGNVIDGSLDISELKYLPADHPEFPDLLLRAGDVLFNRTNSPELVGKAAVARDLPEPCSFASYLIRVRCIPELEPEFLAYYLNSAYGRAWARENVTQQVGQANINGSKLRALTIPVPPRSVQRGIVREVKRLLSTTSALARALDDAEARASSLRRTLLREAFRGRLVTQDSSDEPASELLARIRADQAHRTPDQRSRPPDRRVKEQKTPSLVRVEA